MIETGIEEGAGVVSLVIHTDADKELGVLITDETHIFSFVDGVTKEKFRTGSFAEIAVSVEYENSRGSLTTKDGREITAYYAKTVEITGSLTSETATLSDGADVDIWSGSSYVAYMLRNGTELLRVRNLSGPDRVHVGGIESFDMLGEEAQSNILKFYESQGLLYDIDAELQEAYDEYLEQEDKSEFTSHFISQDIVPTASNEQMIYFLTTVSLPISHNHYYEYHIGAAFDRKTGEVIDNWDLFSCSPEEAKQKMLDIASVTDSVLRKEMEMAFQPESIILFQDNLEVSFTQGMLPSQENTYMLGLDYDDKLAEILNKWAFPKSSE